MGFEKPLLLSAETGFGEDWSGRGENILNSYQRGPGRTRGGLDQLTGRQVERSGQTLALYWTEKHLTAELNVRVEGKGGSRNHFGVPPLPCGEASGNFLK